MVSFRSSGLVIGFMAVVLFATSACTNNPYTGERQTSKAAIGAGIGAASGAIIGALTGDNAKERRKRALIGAGIGGVGGAGIGYYMDVQEAKLRERLLSAGVQVQRVGDDIILNMDRSITFASGSSAVRTTDFEVLNSVALVLNEFDKTVIDVMGHTDSDGSASFNQQLSEQRARSVAQYLASQGVLAGRLLSAGYGEARPIASNASAAGKQANRRVEIQISPIQG